MFWMVSQQKVSPSDVSTAVRTDGTFPQIIHHFIVGVVDVLKTVTKFTSPLWDSG